MFTARIFILLISLLELGYDVVLTTLSDRHRKKPLPAEVSDVYEPERYETYLAFTADRKKLSNKFKVINLIIDVILIFSPMYHMIDVWCGHNAYLVYLMTFAIIWVVSTIIGTWSSYQVTFHLKEKYGLNKKDLKEFIKDEVLEGVLEIFLMVCLGEIAVFIGEHLSGWTNDFSYGYVKCLILCVAIGVAIYGFICLARVISYFVMKKQYVFTPLEEGTLRDKIMELQAGVKRPIKDIYVYNESKKSTSKNAFLLKLMWHKEFGIADNFIMENAEDELLAVLSHEVGHLKHKKNILNFISYGMMILMAIVAVYLVANPEVVFMINAWVRDSFAVEANNYYLLLIVFSDILKPIMFGVGVYNTYRTRWEEYEADRQAVMNGYGEALIRTFKNMSSDELINVYPHPLIEFIEYDHPGMYQRIKAIREEDDRRTKE